MNKILSVSASMVLFMAWGAEGSNPLQQNDGGNKGQFQKTQLTQRERVRQSIQKYKQEHSKYNQEQPNTQGETKKTPNKSQIQIKLQLPPPPMNNNSQPKQPTPAELRQQEMSGLVQTIPDDEYNRMNKIFNGTEDGLIQGEEGHVHFFLDGELHENVENLRYSDLVQICGLDLLQIAVQNSCKQFALLFLKMGAPLKNLVRSTIERDDLSYLERMLDYCGFDKIEELRIHHQGQNYEPMVFALLLHKNDVARRLLEMDKLCRGIYAYGITSVEVLLWINQQYPQLDTAEFFKILFPDPWIIRLNYDELEKIINIGVQLKLTDLLIYMLGTVVGRMDGAKISANVPKYLSLLTKALLCLSKNLALDNESEKLGDLYDAIKEAIAVANHKDNINYLFDEFMRRYFRTQKINIFPFVLQFEVAQDLGHRIEIAVNSTVELLDFALSSPDPDKKSVAKFLLEKLGIVAEKDGKLTINNTNPSFLMELLCETSYCWNIKIAEMIFESARMHGVVLKFENTRQFNFLVDISDPSNQHGKYKVYCLENLSNRMFFSYFESNKQKNFEKCNAPVLEHFIESADVGGTDDRDALPHLFCFFDGVWDNMDWMQFALEKSENFRQAFALWCGERKNEGRRDVLLKVEPFMQKYLPREEYRRLMSTPVSHQPFFNFLLIG